MDRSAEENNQPKNEVLPEWVVEQSKSRGEWFAQIVDTSPSNIRELLLNSPDAKSIQDVIIGAKPATDFMYTQGYASNFKDCLQRVPAPTNVPAGHLQMIELLDRGGENIYWLVNLHALPHIAGHNPEVFGGLKNIEWRKNELPTITDPKAFY